MDYDSLNLGEHTSCRWRKEYGGLPTEQVRQIKNLKTENAWLRRDL
jgi:hypothetical protein